MSELNLNKKGLYLGTRKENIYEYMERNKGLCIVYGATVWSELILCDLGGEIKIDYFCDKQAEMIHSLSIKNIPVINCNQLKDLINESGKRATIIICVGTKKATVNSIYRDLIKLNIEADVFDYFENLYIFSDHTFEYRGQNILLYEHPYNCGYFDGRMTERSVELALAKEWLENCNGNVAEVGAVTPYYFYSDKISDVIDPTDQHIRVNCKNSIFDVSLRGKNVLSISTVEHIGLNEYGLTENMNVIDAIEKILNEAESYLITAPLGYNHVLDNWVRDNRDNPIIRIMKRGINNHWIEISTYDFEEINYGPMWAYGLLIIEKTIC